jgi:hypothetical protein
MPEAGLSFGTTLACTLHHLMDLRKLRNLKVAATKSLNLGYYLPQSDALSCNKSVLRAFKTNL